MLWFLTSWFAMRAAKLLVASTAENLTPSLAWMRYRVLEEADASLKSELRAAAAAGDQREKGKGEVKEREEQEDGRGRGRRGEGAAEVGGRG